MSEINEVDTQESIDEGIPRVTFTVRAGETVQAPVDDSLSVSGMAADAKATGDAIEAAQTELQAAIDELDDDLKAVAGTMFPVGSIYVSTSATAPTFGGENWNWQEIMIPVTNDDLTNGSRSYEAKGESDTPGSVHFWLRVADTEVA